MEIALASLVLLEAASCHRGEPPSPVGVDASVAPLPPPSVAVAAAPADTASRKDAGTERAEAPRAEHEPDAGGAGGDPGLLPQTRDKPSSTSAGFQARAATLFRAIAEDDPKIGMAFFFPVTAYAQVKAVQNPQADWKRRLVSAYERDIHALHERLGARAGEAKLLRVEVPERAKWVEPDEEYNKIGYFRVYGTKLVYASGDGGPERTLGVSSLISWRGEWYVVHLTGFK